MCGYPPFGAQVCEACQAETSARGSIDSRLGNRRDNIGATVLSFMAAADRYDPADDRAKAEGRRAAPHCDAPIQYVHVTNTVPQGLRALLRANQCDGYALLMEAPPEDRLKKS
jgi:hypothetical protein